MKFFVFSTFLLVVRYHIFKDSLQMGSVALILIDWSTFDCYGATSQKRCRSSLLPFQSWSNLDQEPLSIGKELLNNLSMKMIKSKDSVQSEHESDFPDDHNDIEVPVARSKPFHMIFLLLHICTCM